MISFLAVLMLSFITLYAGTYVADRVEHRCAACREVASDTADRVDQ